MKKIVNGIVLRRSDWRDYDRMVTLLTPEGLLEAVVRGCRRPKSPLLMAAEPFSAGEFELYQGGGRYSVEQFRATDVYYPLRADYDRLTHGAYYLRVAGVAAQEHDCTELFDILVRALAHLAYGTLSAPVITMAFELHVLRILGLSPRMTECVRCGRPVETAAWFDAQGGGVACEKCRGTLPDLSDGARRILYKTPRVRFDAVEKLEGHPDCAEAGRFARLYFNRRMDWPPESGPDLLC